ncbi:MAG: response regulator, partial [Gemmatimonadota bacterium]|nr:response regulator [Gemmatimonadota bacterium]
AEDRAVVRRRLREQGGSVTLLEAETGAEGLEICRTQRPGCVLLDFHLPDMTGIEFLEALGGGARSPGLPVVMLTVEEEQASAATALHRGAQDYVVKGTMTPSGLNRVIENAIEKFSIRRELEEKRAALELQNRQLDAIRNQLQANLAELAEATRAKDQFLAVMSHEMRTPLNVILGYADLLEMGIGGELAPGQRPQVERIQVGGKRLLDLINDVLDLVRADGRKLDLDLCPVDLLAVLEEVVALLESQSRAKGIGLVVEPCDPPLPLVTADLQRLRQVLTNLVDNAIKFTDEGKVTIRCVPSPDGTVQVAISDTGIGIAPEVLPLIFADFYQAEGELTRVYGGSGLGLAISQRLAQLMGGEVRAASRLGEGSVFTLLLPAAAAEEQARPDDVSMHAERMAAHETTAEAAALEPVSVVAFGEREEALEELGRRLRPSVRLVWTTDAAEVPELARRERASLVVLNVAGADGGAWNAALALRDLPELAATAVLLLPSIPPSGTESESGGLDLGGVSLVPEPFTASQLTHAVRSAARGTSAAPSDRSDSRSYDVLVVDDDADSRRVAANFLGTAHATVREAADGESALADMRRKAPDVAVLDLMMPVLDGFGVLAAMRADPLLSAIPVVVLSAKTLTDAEREFLARSAVRVLQKGEHRLSDVAALVLRAAAGPPVGGG